METNRPHTPLPSRIADVTNGASLPVKWIAVALCAMLVCAIVPLFAISHYSFPASDDFAFGDLTHAAWLETGSVFQTISAACKRVGQSYSEWQGTFSAIFLFSLQPAVFDYRLYPLTTYLLLGSLIATTFYFLHALMVRRLKMPLPVYLLTASGALLLQILFVPAAEEAFFWYNGGIYYTFFYACMLFLLGLLLRYPLSDRRRVLRLLPIALTAFFIGGGNYTTALLTCCVVALLSVLFFRARGARAAMLTAFVFCLAGLLISAAAPGNAERQSLFQGIPPVRAILLSFQEALKHAARWMTPGYIAALLFLAPLFYGSIRRSGLSFRYPLVVLALSLCLFSAQFTPPLYAMGDAGAGRQVNIYYYAFILFSVLDLYYLAGWFSRVVLPDRKDAPAEKAMRVPTVWLLVFCLFFSLCLYGDASMSKNTTVRALFSLRKGEAQTYAAEMDARVRLLEDPSVRDVVLPRLSAVPVLFAPDRLTADPNSDISIDIARYYGKDTVRIGTPAS